MLKRRSHRGRQTGWMSHARVQSDPLSPIGPRLAGAFDEAEPAPAFPSSERMGSLAELLGEHDGSMQGGGVVCPCCRGSAKRVVRARPGGARHWVAVCAICAGRLLAGHPGTIVGGRVRPRLRRAG